MKRLAILFVSLTLAAACGSKSKPATTTPDNAMESTEAAPGGDGASDGATEEESADEGAATKQAAPPSDPCGGGE